MRTILDLLRTPPLGATSVSFRSLAPRCYIHRPPGLRTRPAFHPRFSYLNPASAMAPLDESSSLDTNSR